MQNRNRSAAEARLCLLLDEGDENKSYSEPTTDQTTADGYAVDLMFPTEDRPNG
ncbi:hypothetical protein [Flexivirga oryzae]|uniref:Uncharacterized protein n=1 Tax=Flexivirga oryzae TaxID=1794944 RepID=A0A839N7I7_9MICO|nr:hypothetical protein [Flexivirga oryzae]MBB2892103.1 hypothetical protein [Flexivirga oryzae]